MDSIGHHQGSFRYESISCGAGALPVGVQPADNVQSPGSHWCRQSTELDCLIGFSTSVQASLAIPTSLCESTVYKDSSMFEGGAEARRLNEVFWIPARFFILSRFEIDRSSFTVGGSGFCPMRFCSAFLPHSYRQSRQMRLCSILRKPYFVLNS